MENVSTVGYREALQRCQSKAPEEVPDIPWLRCLMQEKLVSDNVLFSCQANDPSVSHQLAGGYSLSDGKWCQPIRQNSLRCAGIGPHPLYYNFVVEPGVRYFAHWEAVIKLRSSSGCRAVFPPGYDCELAGMRLVTALHPDTTILDHQNRRVDSISMMKLVCKEQVAGNFDWGFGVIFKVAERCEQVQLAITCDCQSDYADVDAMILGKMTLSIMVPPS